MSSDFPTKQKTLLSLLLVLSRHNCPSVLSVISNMDACTAAGRFHCLAAIFKGIGRNLEYFDTIFVNILTTNANNVHRSHSYLRKTLPICLGVLDSLMPHFRLQHAQWLDVAPGVSQFLLCQPRVSFGNQLE